MQQASARVVQVLATRRLMPRLAEHRSPCQPAQRLLLLLPLAAVAHHQLLRLLLALALALRSRMATDIARAAAAAASPLLMRRLSRLQAQQPCPRMAHGA